MPTDPLFLETLGPVEGDDKLGLLGKAFMSDL